MSDSILILNIQAQEEIKQQLQAEISKLEADTKTANGGSMVKFFQSELTRYQKLNEEIRLEIKEANSNIANLQMQHRQNQQNQESIQKEISSIKKLRNNEIVENLKNSSTAGDTLAKITQLLKSQIEELTNNQANLEKQITTLKGELHSLVNDQLISRKEVASKEWESELASEKHQNNINKRRRSNTLSGTPPKVFPKFQNVHKQTKKLSSSPKPYLSEN